MIVQFFGEDKQPMFSAEMPCVMDSMYIKYNGKTYMNKFKPEFIFEDTRDGTELTCVNITLHVLGPAT